MAATEPQTILYVIGSLDVGGAERHLARILPELDRRHWRAEVYCTGEPGSLAPGLRAAGVPVHAAPLPGRRDASLGYRVLRVVLATAALALFMLRHRPRVVHFFLPQAYLIGGLCALVTMTGVRVMSRRSLNVYQSKHPRLARVERWLHGRMQAVLANSLAVARQLLDEGVNRRRLGLIYNGIDLESFGLRHDRQAIRRRLDIPADALVFAMVANLIAYKGHADLLDALTLIADRLPAPWCVLMVGRDDGVGPALALQAEQAGLAGNIVWLGARSDIPDLLAASDIGLLCSHQEGFSNAVLEAMAASLPMVVTDVGGNAEAVLDGVTGRVVPPHEPKQLANAILSLALDPDRQVMGQTARRRVEAHFSLPACVARYEACYAALLNGRAIGEVAELSTNSLIPECNTGTQS